MSTDLALFASITHQLADAARSVVTPHYRGEFQVDTKSDASPVTAIDRAVETRLREIIEKERPEDGIIGEEFDDKDTQNGYRWVLDPIDGTKAFMLGLTHFTTLIALTFDGRPVLGCIDQAIVKDRWIGGANIAGERSSMPTTHNGKIVQTRQTKALSDATLSSHSPNPYMGEALDHSTPQWQRFKKLHSAAKMMNWGGDALLYASVASGHCDIVMDCDLGTHDYCALVPIIEGAGGIMSDWEGLPLTIDSTGDVLACATAQLHQAALNEIA
jgi:inositol-phosphate phosphatase/L-galactose 1-phosphate phosphatase/histidinol-phosphatase